MVHTTIFPDSLPNVILEGMLCKKPVIASDVGGVREIITSNEQGILYKNGDVKALVKAMLFLFDNPNERRLIALKGYERVNSVFNYEDYVSRMEQTLKNEFQ